MPQYRLQCLESEGGCGHVIDFECLMSELDEKRPKSCPNCRKRKPLKSVFFSPKAHLLESIGHIADVNTDKISDDEKYHINKKNNEYKESDTKWVEGPGGRMQRIKNDR